MVTLRTVIFIDGENFRNNLRHFGFKGDVALPEYRLEERHFYWNQFFKGIIEEFDKLTNWNHQLIRVYWYYAASISTWSESPRLALKVVEDYADRVKLTTQQVTLLAKGWYQKERRYFEKLREQVFEDIQRSTDFLEFKYVGQYVIRPYRVYRIDCDKKGTVTNYLGQQQGEKGVDVGIAVDMIAKMDNYDVAILVSGDADFLPAVKYLKDNLKYVYQFSIAEGVPPQIEYLSPYLKGITDCFAFFDEIRLLSEFLNPQGIPPEVYKSIEARIDALKLSPPPAPPSKS